MWRNYAKFACSLTIWVTINVSLELLVHNNIVDNHKLSSSGPRPDTQSDRNIRHTRHSFSHQCESSPLLLIVHTTSATDISLYQCVATNGYGSGTGLRWFPRVAQAVLMLILMMSGSPQCLRLLVELFCELTHLGVVQILAY